MGSTIQYSVNENDCIVYMTFGRNIVSNI